MNEARFENRPHWKSKNQHPRIAGSCRILTTPEEIVREYRAQKAEGIEQREKSFNPMPEPDTFGLVLRGVTFAAVAAVIVIAIYVVGWRIIPFVESIRWQ